MMNEQGMMRLAHDVYGYDEVMSITAEEALYLQRELMERPIDIPLASSTCGSLVADDLFRLIDDLRTEYRYGDAQLWTIHPHTYDQLRWWSHCAKAYRLPRRKLRKCAMRRIYARRQHARGRYL